MEYEIAKNKPIEICRCRYIKPLIIDANTVPVGACFDENVTEIINLDKWDVSQLTSLDGIFAGCQYLEHINGIRKWHNNVATLTSHMFTNCKLLSSEDQPIAPFGGPECDSHSLFITPEFEAHFLD